MAPPRVLVCLAIVVSLVTAAAAAKPSVLELIALAGRALQDRLAWMQPETMSASPTSRATTTAPTATSRSPPPPHAEDGPPVRADSHDHHRTAGAPSAPPANQMDPPRLTTAPTCKLVSYIGGSGTDASDVFRADDGRLLVIRQGCAACGTSTATDEAINDDDALGSSEDDSDSDSNDGWESDEEGFFSEAMSKLCEGLTSFGGALEMML
uniref:Uncharacterized protein n=1 Tax=Aegilops tauschii TaxID=37682 RepID=M8BVL0_AEGTA